MPSVFQFFQLLAPRLSRSALRHLSFAIRHSLPAPCSRPPALCLLAPCSLLLALSTVLSAEPPAADRAPPPLSGLPAPGPTLPAPGSPPPAPAAAAADLPGSLLLPPGSELLRSIAADQITLRLLSSPFFSPAPTGWPTLEVGPASLAFFRDRDGGAMLLLGDQPLQLPATIALDADGRSRQPLDLTLTYDRTARQGTLLLGPATYAVNATAPAGPLQVAISAGGEAPWIITALELRTDPPPSSLPAPRSPLSPSPLLASPATPAERAAARRQAAAQAKALFTAGSDDLAEKLLTDRNDNAKDTAEWHLETANSLVQTAFSLTRAGRPDRAGALARRALGHLDAALALGPPPPVAAAADETAAYIHERLLGDPAAARLALESSARRRPDGAAAAGLTRLTRIEAEAASRGRAPNR